MNLGSHLGREPTGGPERLRLQDAVPNGARDRTDSSGAFRSARCQASGRQNVPHGARRQGRQKTSRQYIIRKRTSFQTVPDVRPLARTSFRTVPEVRPTSGVRPTFDSGPRSERCQRPQTPRETADAPKKTEGAPDGRRPHVPSGARDGRRPGRKAPVRSEWCQRRKAPRETEGAPRDARHHQAAGRTRNRSWRRFLLSTPTDERPHQQRHPPATRVVPALRHQRREPQPFVQLP